MRSARGSRGEFSAFYATAYPELVAQSVAITGDAVLAEAVTKDALMRAWSAWPALSRAADPLPPVRWRAVQIAAERAKSAKTGPRSADMADWLRSHLDEHQAVAEAMDTLAEEIRATGALVCERLAAGGTVYTFGNGGSAADAQHLTGELVGHFRRDRRPLPAVTLSTDPSAMTCIANDYSYADVFARQVDALARPGDVVVAFTTTGRSANVTTALAAAQARGATTLLFAGGDGGPARIHADRTLLVPSKNTQRIQEMHTLMLHVISEMVDAWAAGEEPAP